MTTATETMILTRRTGGGNWCAHVPDCEHSAAIREAVESNEITTQEVDVDGLNRLAASGEYVDVGASCVRQE